MKRFAGSVALILLGIVFAEGLLQVLVAWLPAAQEQLSGTKRSALADPRLLNRGDPAVVEEHDAYGFRNARRPERADIVAIGDSQTFGEGVPRERAWPQQLAARTGLEVYQLAFGGYGPGQYEALVTDALTLTPRTILVAWYFGNDLADAFTWVYDNGRLPELRAQNPESLATIRTAKSTKPPISRAWLDTVAAKRGLLDKPLQRWWSDRVLDRSKVVALYRRVLNLWRGPRPSAGKKTDWEKVQEISRNAPAALLFRHQVSHAPDGPVRTLLTPAARLAVLDSADPRIAEGYRLSIALFERIATQCRGHSELAVLLIPTKELVFADTLAPATDAPAELMRLIQEETAIRARAARELHALGIRTIDALPPLRAVVFQGRNPYREDWDGHPNQAGYAAIAQAVAQQLGLERRARTAP